jgi:hypothetical protein
MLRAIPFRVKS